MKIVEIWICSLALTSLARGSPDVSSCNQYGFYCGTKDKFVECVDNLPPSSYYVLNDCPSGTLCSMDCSLPCVQDPSKCTQQTSSSSFPTYSTNSSPVPSLPTSNSTTLTTPTIPITTTTAQSSTNPPPTSFPWKPTPTPFECQTKGVFPNLYNCSRFYQCIPSVDGGVVKYDFECPQGSNFDYVTLRCTLSPDVRCATAPSPQCNQHGFYCVTSTTAQLCPEAGQPPGGALLMCVAGNYCSMDCEFPCWASPSCANTTPMPSTQPTPTSTSTTTSVDYPFTCKLMGRFPNEKDCSQFYLCLDNGAGGFYQLTNTCPGGSMFDSESLTCTYNAEVKCMGNKNLPFRCTSAGRFPNLNSCSKFFLCMPDGNGGFYVNLMYCPYGSRFDAVRNMCTMLNNVTCGSVESFPF